MTGKNSTLMDEQLGQKQEFSRNPTASILNTVGGKQFSVAGRVALRLFKRRNSKRIESTDANTPADLPIRAPKPLDAILSRWPHVRDVSAGN